MMSLNRLSQILTKSDQIVHFQGLCVNKNYHCLAALSASVLNERCFSRNPLSDSKRYFPKPRKNTQYKYDYRIFKDAQYTADPIKMPKLHGRDPDTGKRINQHVQGGYNFDYFWITAYPHRPPPDGFYEERVLEVRCDPNHTAHIALLAGLRGRRWTFAVDGWKAGDIIRITNFIPEIPLTPKPKEIWPVGAMAEGTQVCMVEVIPEARDFTELRSIVAGSSSTIAGRRGEYTVLKLPSQHEVMLDKNCYATVGRISNPQFKSLNWGTMNMKRRMGIKQGSGLYHKKDGYCGRKIKPDPPPMFPERRPDPPPRYNFTLSVADTHAGFGTNEYNPVLKGG